MKGSVALKIVAIISFGVASIALGLVCLAVGGLAAVAVVFCDAPGMTAGDCLRGGAATGFHLGAPLLPWGIGTLLLGTVVLALSRVSLRRKGAN
jgi:hypothetical protein